MSRKAELLTVPQGVKLPTDYAPATAAPAFCQYVAPIEPSFTPAKERLLITVAVGKSLEALRVTRPAMEAYALKIGADFIALTNRTQTWPLAEKFRVGRFAAQYERTLYVDADVFIRANAPDIFEHVPAGAVAMHNDFQSGDALPDWLRREQWLLQESQGVEAPAGCWNSGVMVCDREEALQVWRAPAKPFPVSHCMEQGWITKNAMETERLFSLDPRWNWQFWIHPDFSDVGEANFIHVSGLQGPAERKFLLPLLRALALR